MLEVRFACGCPFPFLSLKGGFLFVTFCFWSVLVALEVRLLSVPQSCSIEVSYGEATGLSADDNVLLLHQRWTQGEMCGRTTYDGIT